MLLTLFISKLQRNDLNGSSNNNNILQSLSLSLPFFPFCFIFSTHCYFSPVSLADNVTVRRNRFRRRRRSFSISTARFIYLYLLTLLISDLHYTLHFPSSSLFLLCNTFYFRYSLISSSSFLFFYFYFCGV